MADIKTQKTMTVSVKGVSVKIWEKARVRAVQSNVPLGEMVNISLELTLASPLSRQRWHEPEKPDDPGPLPALAQDLNPELRDAMMKRLFDVMTHVGSLAAATHQNPPKRVLNRLYRHAERWIIMDVPPGTPPPRTPKETPTPAIAHDKLLRLEGPDKPEVSKANGKTDHRRKPVKTEPPTAAGPARTRR